MSSSIEMQEKASSRSRASGSSAGLARITARVTSIRSSVELTHSASAFPS
jgi:hypothetical protein